MVKKIKLWVIGILASLALIVSGYALYVHQYVFDKNIEFTKADPNASNYISYVRNLVPTFYLNETIDLNNVSIIYKELVNGKWEESEVPVTLSMIKGLHTRKLGRRQMTIEYNGATYDIIYHVIKKSSEMITSASFETGIYYAENTEEETEHFEIFIQAGSYLVKNYKTIIEKIYNIEEKVTGLKFPTDRKIRLDIYGGVSSVGGAIDRRILISHGYMFTSQDSGFLHELAHVLQTSQQSGWTPSATIREGFATYVEYLTAKEIYINYPELCQYVSSPERALLSVCSWGEGLYQYDFEEKVLELERDEIISNSQYEAGGRFFAYLHHKFGDFCGWATDSRFNTEDLERWKALLKQYYAKKSLFRDFYPYEQSLGNKYYSFCGVDFAIYNNANYYLIPFDKYDNLSLTNKYNYYLNLGKKKEIRAQRYILYNDLYVNLKSINLQMKNFGIQCKNMMMTVKQGNKGVSVELYNAQGQLLRTVTDSYEPFSVDDVSFFKLVGKGYAYIDLKYDETEVSGDIAYDEVEGTVGIKYFIGQTIVVYKENLPIIVVVLTVVIIVVGSSILIIDERKRKKQNINDQQVCDIKDEDVNDFDDEEMLQGHVDLHGDVFYLDENGQPFYIDKEGNPFYIDQNGNPFYIDENGKPFYVLENGEIYYVQNDNLDK